MELKTIPFNGDEKALNYVYAEFTERGLPMAMLCVVDENFKLSSKTNYKFGLIDNENNYLWFFMGKIVAKDRYKALEIYTALLNHCNKFSLGKPFAIKD